MFSNSCIDKSDIESNLASGIFYLLADVNLRSAGIHSGEKYLKVDQCFIIISLVVGCYGLAVDLKFLLERHQASETATRRTLVARTLSLHSQPSCSIDIPSVAVLRVKTDLRPQITDCD